MREVEADRHLMSSVNHVEVVAHLVGGRAERGERITTENESAGDVDVNAVFETRVAVDAASATEKFGA